MSILGGLFSKFYLVVGASLLLGYLVAETRGVVFAGTDSRPGLATSSSSGGRGSGRSGGGGVFFFGSGYRGGK